MNEEIDKYNGFVDLFPTRIHRFCFNKKILNSLPSTLLEVDPSVWSRNISNSYLNIKDSVDFAEINKEVLRLATQVCPREKNIGKWNIVGAWLNSQKPGQEGFEFHSHCDSFMSCVLYLKGKDMSLGFRDTFRQSNNSAASNPISYDIQVSHSWHPDKWLPVNIGDLVVFPSYQLHSPNTNSSQDNRISVAYNLMPDKKKLIDPWAMDLNFN